MNRTRWIIVLAVIVAIVAIGGYFAFAKLKTPSPTPTNPVVSMKTSIPTDWATYQNAKFGFSFRYPPTAKVCEILPETHPQEDTILDLGIGMRGEGCTSTADIWININNTRFSIGETSTNPDLAGDFYKGYGGIDASLNPNLSYFSLDGLRAFGGVIKRPLPLTKGALEFSAYFNQDGHYFSVWDRHYDLHEEDTIRIIKTLGFDPSIYTR